jgi:hypothetical protein
MAKFAGTVVDTRRTPSFADSEIVARMDSGLEIRFPVARNPRLASSTAAQLNNIRYHHSVSIRLMSTRICRSED